MFVCGGTAGHINPALAIAGKLREIMPEASFLFVGTGREMEKRLIPAAGFELENITVTSLARGVRPRDIKHNVKSAKNLVVSSRESEKLIRSFKPDAVIGTGGYVCYPVLRKAAAMGIPTALHESNAVPGLTTKLLAGKVDCMMTAFPGVEKYYRNSENVVFTGTPVRGEFFSLTKTEARAKLGIKDMPLVVSFWGSLGASAMNEMMADFIVMNAEKRGFYNIHSTGGGAAGPEKMAARLSARGLENVPGFIDIRPYIDDMGTVMAAADIILCRSGASTLAEITQIGVPSLLVPSPNVTNNHQEKNARELEASGAARVILESECTGAKLFEAVSQLLGDSKTLAAMSASALVCGKRDATEIIADKVLELVRG